MPTPVCAVHPCWPTDTTAYRVSNARVRHMRHAAINDTVNRALNGAGVHAALAPVGLCGSLGLQPDCIP